MLCSRLKTPILLLGIVVFLLLSSCQSNAPSAPTKASPATPTIVVTVGESRPAETPTPMPSPTPRSEPVSTEGSQREAPITFTGTVQDVMYSARIIMLQEPVKGFLYVALTQDTRLISREGRNIALQDIEAGMRIRVTGRPGSQGTLLAEEVQILP